MTQCPHCKSLDTQSIGGTDHDNIKCNHCGRLFIAGWQHYKGTAENMEKALNIILRIATEELRCGSEGMWYQVEAEAKYGLGGRTEK